MSLIEPRNTPLELEQGPAVAGILDPFGLPRALLHRFSFESPRIGWGFLDTYHGLPAWGGHGWTDCYLILWDGAEHDDEWFAQNRNKSVWAYDNWEAPHYGDAVVLHKIHLEPGVCPEEREKAESETIRLALRHLRNPIPANGPVTVWQSVQYQEKIDAGVFYIYQALFLEPEGDRDLLRLAYALRSVEDWFDPPETLRLDSLELKGWDDCCVEVSVPRDKFLKVYREAVFGPRRSSLRTLVCQFVAAGTAWVRAFWDCVTRRKPRSSAL